MNLHRFTDGVQIGNNNNKRKTSTSPDHCAKQPRCTTTAPAPNLPADNPTAAQGNINNATQHIFYYLLYTFVCGMHKAVVIHIKILLFILTFNSLVSTY